MSDDALQEINSALNYVCYGPLNEHLSKFGNVDEAEDILFLLEPHFLIEVINQSVKLQVEFLMEIYNSINSNKSVGLSKLKFKKELEGILKSNFTSLNNQFSIFDSKLTNFRSNLRRLHDESADESFSGAVFGGVVGGIIAGPIGAAIGGAIFGSGETSADTEINQEYVNLINFYQTIASEVETSFDNCFEDCKDVLVELLDGNESEESELLLE